MGGLEEAAEGHAGEECAGDVELARDSGDCVGAGVGYCVRYSVFWAVVGVDWGDVWDVVCVGVSGDVVVGYELGWECRGVIWEDVEEDGVGGVECVYCGCLRGDCEF